MTTQITYTSLWEHKQTGRRCRIISKQIEDSVFSEFLVKGYNPLPCVSFVGTYVILSNWLRTNGWERVADTTHADTMVIRETI